MATTNCQPTPEPIPVCIEVPRVFDEARVKRCLIYAPGPDTIGNCTPSAVAGDAAACGGSYPGYGYNNRPGTDSELREILEGVRMDDIRTFVPCKNFNLIINSIIRIPVRDPNTSRNAEGFKRVIVNFTINFDVDVVLCTGQTRTLHYSVNRTETIQSLYCPESLAQIAVRRPCNEPGSIDLDPEIIKLVILPQCLSMDFTPLTDGTTPRMAIDITLAYDLLVKCELIVQLCVLSQGYCAVPDIEGSASSPCEDFCNSDMPPVFYPTPIDDAPCTPWTPTPQEP